MMTCETQTFFQGPGGPGHHPIFVELEIQNDKVIEQPSQALLLASMMAETVGSPCLDLRQI